MKHFITKIVLLFACAFMGVSCIHDAVDDLGSIGKKTPNVVWEGVPLAWPAGGDISFLVHYYPYEGKTIKGLEAWYYIDQTTSYSATCPLVNFTFTQSKDTTELVRAFQHKASYEHKEEYLDKKTGIYSFTGSFPSSYTLKPTSWSEVEVFDHDKFDAYFPANFKTAFRDSLYPKLKVADLKKILTVTNPRMTDVEFMTHVDSVKNENAGRYDHFIIESSKPFIKEKFYDIRYDSLFYNAGDLKFKVEYNKSYTLGAKFRVADSENAQGFSDERKIELN